MNSKLFVKNVRELKGGNLDLSLGEDLSIAVMNLVSLEEHFQFSYMKTEDKRFLDFIEEAREIRKSLLSKIVKRDDGDYSEKWCISKHLLAGSMRLTEVGTKYLHDGDKHAAEEMFRKAFDIYSIFWALNDSKVQRSIGASDTKMSKIKQAMKKLLDCCKE